MKYAFNDFYTDMTSGWLLIEDGGKERKIEISILNPLIPVDFRNRIIEMLNAFIVEHDIKKPLETIEWISGFVTAFIDKDMEPEGKYFLSLYISVKRDGKAKSDAVIVPILPTDECFGEFRTCVMSELESMIFGKGETDV